MKNTRTAAQLPDTQKCAAKNSAAQNTPPMVTVYDGGITEKIVHGRLDTKLNFLFARNWGSYPLKDGRYVYEECTGSKKNLHVKKKVYSGIRPDIFEFLTETDRNDTNGQRKAKDHADYSVRYEDGGEDENGDFHQSAMDKAAFQQWVNKETWDAAEDDPIYPDELLKQDFVPGENKVNNQRWQMRRQVIEQYIPNLSRKDREAITKHYGMGITLEQAGAEEGLDKQAIWNRLDRDATPPRGASATFTVHQQKSKVSYVEGDITVNLVDNNESVIASLFASDGDQLLLSGYHFADWNGSTISAQINYLKVQSWGTNELYASYLEEASDGAVRETVITVNEAIMANDKTITLKLKVPKKAFSALPVLSNTSGSHSVSYSEYQDTGITRAITLPTTAGKWETTVKDLIRKDADGNLYQYYITEDSCSPAAVSVEFQDKDGHEIENEGQTIPATDPLSTDGQKVVVTNTYETTNFIFTKAC